MENDRITFIISKSKSQALRMEAVSHYKNLSQWLNIIIDNHLNKPKKRGRPKKINKMLNIMDNKINEFITEYVRLCLKYNMEIDTTEELFIKDLKTNKIIVDDLYINVKNLYYSIEFDKKINIDLKED